MENSILSTFFSHQCGKPCIIVVDYIEVLSMISSVSEITRLWSRVLSKIETKLNDSTIFSSFFDDSYITEIRGDTLYIAVNSSLAAQLMRTKYADLINESISEVTESNFKAVFLSPEELKKDIKPQATAKKKSQFFQNAVLKPDLTFDNFVVGAFNREASQAALLVARNPGKMFNPLFIHSNSGLGKTHLLHALGNFIIKNGNPNARILYITGQDFVDQYVKYVRGEQDSENLKDYFKEVDVLLFDDVQYLAKKVNTEEMFFYVYNAMINDGKQIVVTSDKQPQELSGLEERLITRFSQGLVVKIDEPDQNTCVEILKKKIENNGLDLKDFDPAVIEFFALKFSSNIRELEGALNRLIFTIISSKNSGKITLDVASEAVSSLISGKAIAKEMNEQKIINVVADYYNLVPNQLTSKIRTGQIALARHIAMYLMRTLLDVPFKKIGDALGGKDHSTVISGVEKVEKELKTNIQLQEAVNELISRIKP